MIFRSIIRRYCLRSFTKMTSVGIGNILRVRCRCYLLRYRLDKPVVDGIVSTSYQRSAASYISMQLPKLQMRQSGEGKKLPSSINAHIVINKFGFICQFAVVASPLRHRFCAGFVRAARKRRFCETNVGGLLRTLRTRLWGPYL